MHATKLYRIRDAPTSSSARLTLFFFHVRLVKLTRLFECFFFISKRILSYAITLVKKKNITAVIRWKLSYVIVSRCNLQVRRVLYYCERYDAINYLLRISDLSQQIQYYDSSLLFMYILISFFNVRYNIIYTVIYNYFLYLKI